MLVPGERDDDAPVVAEHPPSQTISDRPQLTVDPFTDIRLQFPGLWAGRRAGGPQLGSVGWHGFALPEQLRNAPAPCPMFLDLQHSREQVLLEAVEVLGTPTLPQR